MNNRFSGNPERVAILSYHISLFFDDDKMICSRYKEERFTVYDMANESSLAFGDSIATDNCPPEHAFGIIQGLCFGNPKQKRYVWASMWGEIVEIYDYETTGKIKTVANIKGRMPVLNNSSAQPTLSVNTKIGVVSITGSDKYVYMLYNDNTLMNSFVKKKDVLLCNKILVYDWDGIPQKILTFKPKISSISYNEKYKRLHCA
ncbi:MAG: TolB-like 6-bladed beta-propeller domain-containing protein [Rikenellaceae bacterium]|nr:TolB-like 6-bladed beta-propeller domain-containing protein [Rikenellaceae bacterium]